MKQSSSTPHYYHCATKGFQHSILFSDLREFVAAMNRIAICLARAGIDFPVTLIAFCLMDNHVHFILHGTREDCLKWMALFHRLTMSWQHKHRFGSPVDEPWVYDAWQITDQDDLREKIAYVLRNPMAAGLAYAPMNYRWSSAGLVFADLSGVSGRPLGDMSTYETRNYFGTRVELPDDWIMLPDGMIWPGCYTNYKLVERLFGQPSNYLFALNQRVESKVNEEMLRKELSLPDQDVLLIAREESQRLYGLEEIEVLDLNQRIVLCTGLSKRSGITLKQLGRIFHIPQSDMKRLFGRQ